MKKKVKIYTSPVPRVNDTANIIKDKLESDFWIETSLRIRDVFSYENPKYCPVEINEERKEKREMWMEENDFVRDFLDGKRRTKPSLLAKNYLKEFERIFNRVVRKKIPFSIIAFRHWAKSENWNLNESWKKQAKKIWEKIWKNVEKHENTIFIATHNTINESIVRCLIANNDLPDEWKDPLDFTETIKYTFYPEIENKEPYMEIKWRGIKKKVSFDNFKSCVSWLRE